jgi:hypothetical protein
MPHKGLHVDCIAQVRAGPTPGAPQRGKRTPKLTLEELTDSEPSNSRRQWACTTETRCPGTLTRRHSSQQQSNRTLRGREALVCRDRSAEVSGRFGLRMRLVIHLRQVLKVQPQTCVVVMMLA